MNLVRWGVLGTAAIAKSRFIPTMQGADSARLVAVASRYADKAQAVVRAFGIPGHYGSYAALLADPEIDALYIPVPNPCTSNGRYGRLKQASTCRAGIYSLSPPPTSSR